MPIKRIRDHLGSKRYENKLQEFLSRFESSGKKQSAFGEQEGISASMLSYYLHKGRALKKVGTGFAALELSSASPSMTNMIIHLPNGIEMEIPI